MTNHAVVSIDEREKETCGESLYIREKCKIHLHLARMRTLSGSPCRLLFTIPLVRLLYGQPVILAVLSAHARRWDAAIELRNAVGRLEAEGRHTAPGLVASQGAAQLLEVDRSHHDIVRAAAASHRGRVETERVALELQSVHEEVASV